MRSSRSTSQDLPGRARRLGALLAIVALGSAACSDGGTADDAGDDASGDTAGTETSGDTACSGRTGESTGAAKRLDACLAPSVAFIEVAGFGAGSGVVIERDGERYVLTNLHVVDPDPVATVVLPGEEDERVEDVPVLGVDKLHDLALLGPVSTTRPPVRLADDEVAKGDEVWLVGYPGETADDPEATIAEGIVSRLRTNEVFDLHYIQTDASIAGGQSGGALADADGDVVGISGLSFAEDSFALALSATDVDRAVDRILAGDGDDYWTFPPADEDDTGETSGTVGLRGPEDAAYLYLQAADEDRTLTFTLDPAGDGFLVVEDYDTGDSIFVDRDAFASSTAEPGVATDPEALESAAAAQGLVLGSPVAPGRYEVEIPARTTAVLTVGLSGLTAAETSVAWTSSIPLFFQADDENDVPLRVGEAHTGVLDYEERDATFLIDLEAGTDYRVTVDSNEGDPGVVITGPGQDYADGWDADDSDTGTYGTDIEEDFAPDASGPHRVIVENYGGAAMAYRLTVDVADEG